MILNSAPLKRRAIISLSFILILVILLEVWAVNRLSTYGEQLSQIDASISQFKLENSILEGEIAARSSLNKIEKIARNLGFEPPSKIQFIK